MATNGENPDRQLTEFRTRGRVGPSWNQTWERWTKVHAFEGDPSGRHRSSFCGSVIYQGAGRDNREFETGPFDESVGRCKHCARVAREIIETGNVTIPEPPPPPDKLSRFVAEYLLLDYTISDSTGSVEELEYGQKITRRRTGRLLGARLYRTGDDEFTIQSIDAEEFIFSISKWEELLAEVKKLQVTAELPKFG